MRTKEEEDRILSIISNSYVAMVDSFERLMIILQNPQDYSTHILLTEIEKKLKFANKDFEQWKDNMNQFLYPKETILEPEEDEY